MLHHIDENHLRDSKNPDSYTRQAKQYFKLVTLNDNSHAVPIGSFTYKIQKYPSDIDVDVVANYTGDLSLIGRQAADDIKRYVKRLSSKKNSYFIDFKCGIDKSGESIHWTKNDIMNGYTKQHGITYQLHESMIQKSKIKIDFIVKYKERFVELATVFSLIQLNNEDKEPINISDNFMETYPLQIISDINEYKNSNPFKAVKRLWSLSRFYNNTNLLKTLEPLINSNLSLLGQVNTDIETIIVMINNIHKLPKKDMLKIIDGFKDRLSTVLDIDIDEDFICKDIDKAYNQFEKGNYSDCINTLSYIEKYILSKISGETISYLRNYGLWPLPNDILILFDQNSVHPNKEGGYVYRPKTVGEYLKYSTESGVTRIDYERLLKQEKEDGYTLLPKWTDKLTEKNKAVLHKYLIDQIEN